MERATLLAAAREAATSAYAPVSHFRVGAAVALVVGDETHIVQGANVETARTYICAERAAIIAACALSQRLGAASHAPGETAPPTITHIAIACIDLLDGAPDWHRAPCRTCRRWLSALARTSIFYLDGVEESLTYERLPKPRQGRRWRENVTD